MSPHPDLALLILAVDDLDRSAAFYEAALRLRPSVEAPPYREYRLPGGLRLGLYRRGGFEGNTGAPTGLPPPGGTTCTELYLFVQDPDAEAQRLQSLGATLLSPAGRRGWGDVVAYLRDPDGNVLALARP